jgi:hypothetical protein
MKPEGKRIFYAYVQQRSFIQTDLDFLAKQFRLTTFVFTSNPKYLIPFFRL